MTFQRVEKSTAWSPQTPQKTSSFAPRPFAIQAQQADAMPATQDQIENEAFEQDKFEETRLQMKQVSGAIAPEEQERLGLLQAKISDSSTQRREMTSGAGFNFGNISVDRPDKPTSLPIQTKLAIGESGDKYEQEADRIAAHVVQRLHAPPGHGMDMSKPPSELAQRMRANIAQRSGSIQRLEIPADEEEVMKKPEEATLQREAMPQKENKTGMPDPLKAGIENLSGISMDDVKVHYNSEKPAQLQALAYAQGTDIHVGPGQEKHLPHEAWHVVQQKQGRVKPTMQMKGVNANDDTELEKEADTMGAKALQMKAGSQTRSPLASSGAIGNTVQRKVDADYASGLELAQRVSAMFAMGTPEEQKAELGKLKIVAEPLKDSKASELAKLATVIAAGNTSILQHPRASQIQSNATKVLSMAYEARDKGHSLDRHGPGVSDSELQHRLSTGVAPDGILSPTTGLSTRFNTHTDYVRTRLAAVQGMKTAITTTRDYLKNELKAFHQAKIDFDKSPAGPHKAQGQPLERAIYNTKKAVQDKVDAIGNPDATKMPVKFVHNAATPAGYITMYQPYSIIVDHGADVGIGFRGRAANQIQIPRPTVANPAGTAPAWTASDKEDHLTKTRTGMDTGANHQQLFGTEYNPDSWEAFQHFPVDEPVGIQIPA